MFDSFGRALAWWLDGIVDAFLLLGARLGGRKRLRLVPSGQGWAIEGRSRRSELRLADAEGGPRLEPAATRRELAGRPVDVLLSPDAALVRHLDPLPAESRQYLDGIVRHQLERLVPWRADNILYTYNVVPAAHGDNRLVVTVAATARNLHAPLYAAIAAHKPRRVRVLYRDVDKIGDVAIPLDLDGTRGVRTQRLRYGVMSGLAALLAIALGGFTWFFVTNGQASAALESTQVEIADLRKKLAERGPQGSAGDREAQTILERKRAMPPAVLALDKLSQALPDDTWLTELHVNNEGQIRITGISQNVADLVPQIDGAAIFSDAIFFSPTTRLQAGEGDRFHLQMKLRQTQAAAPSQAPAGPRR
jgi:general secretion pathway protein L